MTGVTFKSDPPTPYESSAMGELGWLRHENNDGSVQYIPQRRFDVRHGCPQCGGTGYRNYGMLASPPREPRTSDFVPCATCDATGRRL